ncbi:amidohydrolase family protein [Myxococcota bacterium]|nr:amidohydrolase family protein [Myxococcota bacterium]
MFDLVIRGGTIVDGTGEPPRIGDVAVRDGKIAAVGEVSEAGREEIDATGKIVTPGFVDIHTHYDGQATWDPYLTPSSGHGVTTIVLGNCGVGFAPVAPGKQDFLIQLMEGVEDIPGTALSEGIQWEWESFPEFLDALEKREFALDIGTQVPHGAVRAYVMGERGAKNEPATTADIERMAELVEEGVEAGALGFSTSRTVVHRAIDGEPVPGTFAAEDELFGIGRALQRVGKGVFELAPAGAAGEDIVAPRKELDWMLRLSAEIGRPVTFAMIQVDAEPELWREMLDLSAAAVEGGSQVFPQIAGRPSGLIMGLEPGYHPLAIRPSYVALADLPLAERVARLRDPEVRRRILSEKTEAADPMQAFMLESFHKLFPLGEPPVYEPPPEASLAAVAEAQGRPADEVFYDAMLENDGKALFLFHLFNFAHSNCDHMLEMFRHPRAALGLSDGGAHCGQICDASTPTFMLTHWVRDRKGERIPLEFAVKRQTRDTAELYGLLDRGLVEPGLRADLNVIDFDGLTLHAPEMRNDLPAGGSRFVQHADGYVATIVAGEIVARDGKSTGRLSGRLVRGAQADPRAC